VPAQIDGPPRVSRRRGSHAGVSDFRGFKLNARVPRPAQPRLGLKKSFRVSDLLLNTNVCRDEKELALNDRNIEQYSIVSTDDSRLDEQAAEIFGQGLLLENAPTAV
jgi:hypothetical protein